MPNIAERLMTLDEFLAWEREQPERTNEIIQVDGVLNYRLSMSRLASA
jgi:Uma2 family endonuclease